jgi:iron complex transport system substrate-binding protein
MTARRIVSLLPSATEIVCALGLGDRLVGVTHECDFPPAVARLPKVTRTLIPHDAPSREIDALVRDRLTTRRALYELDVPVLDAVRPDLIVTQALCDVCAVAEEEVARAAWALPGRPPVVNLEPTTLAGVLGCVRTVGEAAGVPRQAAEVVASLEARIAAVAARSAGLARPRVVLLEWLDPPISCGHWSPELVEMAGGVEGIGRAGERSRTLTWAEVAAAAPEVLAVACCGFSAARARQDLHLAEAAPGWADLPAVRAGRVFVFDGNAHFSRPGPRLVDSLEWLAHALHPDRHPRPPGPVANR